MLAVKDGERWPPMINSLTVADGLEAALGAVLGRGTDLGAQPGRGAALARTAAVRSGPGAAGVCPAASRICARSARSGAVAVPDWSGRKRRRWLQIISPNCCPGQSLVSRSGAIWRWDGYTIRAGTPTQAAVRLQQRNRLTALRARLAAAEQEAATARTARTAAETASQAAVTAEQSARNARRDWEQKLERARAGLSSLRNQAATATARLAAADDQLARITVERDEAVASLAQVRAAQTALPDIAELRSAVDQARAALSAVRSREAAARAERDALAREHAARVNRRRVIAAERAGWAERAKDAADRVTDLAARQTEAEDALKTLEARPAEIAARRAEALDALAGRRSRPIAARPRPCPTALTQASDADRAARAAEAALATRREDAVRAEGGLQQASHAWGTVAERILERLGANPALPDPPSDLRRTARTKLAAAWNACSRNARRWGRSTCAPNRKPRTSKSRSATIETEREELTTAIAKLRGSIGHLNREGRERLTEVFQQVDQQFPAAVHPHVRRRPRASGAGRLRRSAGGRAGNLRPAARARSWRPCPCYPAASRR